MPFPLARTAQAIYAFVATNFFILLRLTWLPLLINALAATVSTLKLLPYVPALESKNAAEIAAALGPAAGWILLGLAVPLVMNAVAGVAILRYVVRGDRHVSNRFVHVALGAPELRVIAVTLLIALMMFLISIPLSMILGLISGLTHSGAVMTLGSILLVLFLLTIAARWLMAYPIAALEDRISFDRAWSLMRASYSRFVVLMLCVLLPLAMLDVATDLVIVPRSDNVETLARAIESRWILITASTFAVNFLATNVFFAALGIIYRMRTEVSGPRDAAARTA
jgi:hypothetical protein